ncbi:MAG: mycofactocin biosynthesis chaperone MftB [Actinomycetota bacterium]|nr:mycofactocin biosynthesis chaperone MftB [Actinomycetota bacterium]
MTQPATSGADPLDRRLRLHSSVSLRPERFGALAYSFDTRKLSFIKHPDLLRVVESLDGDMTVADALRAAAVDERRWSSFVTALSTLESSEMLELVDPNDPETRDD